MSKSRNPGYQGGNNWGICDRCGQAYRQTELVDQHDGLRVCVYDCYDKRHPQEAVRDKGWECGGDGAQGTGLDWNGAGRLARPDVDPLSFIQEPNDAYFTTIPTGTFGQSPAPTFEDYVSDIGPYWWFDAEAVSDDYTNGYVFDGTDRIQDQSVNDRNLTYASAAPGNTTFETNAINGRAAFRFGTSLQGSMKVLPSGGTGTQEYEDMVAWIFIVIDDVGFVAADDVAMPFATSTTSGGYQYMGFSSNSTMRPPYSGENRWIMSNNSGISKAIMGAGGFTLNGGPYLLSGKFDGASVEASQLRVNGLNPIELSTQLTPVPTTIPQDIYPPTTEPHSIGTRFSGLIPEAINFRKDLSADQVRTIEEGLVSRYGIPGYTYQDLL